ncbi:hypothetical protein D3C71_1315390 [compost metagenome]
MLRLLVQILRFSAPWHMFFQAAPSKKRILENEGHSIRQMSSTYSEIDGIESALLHCSRSDDFPLIPG